ncbi:M domain protein [Clostridium neuense]|uniref:M domain protein n=1 Tax=Clostridium neuense TaxID=1728934 RepID=A0ABW8T9D0_9CLOT
MDKETKQMFELMLNKLDSLDKRQNEIYSIVRSIEHSNNTHKAEIDNLNLKVAHSEGVINKIGDVINKSRSIK